MMVSISRFGLIGLSIPDSSYLLLRSVIDGVYASMSVIPLSFLPQEILAILEYVYILLKYGVCVLVCITDVLT